MDRRALLAAAIAPLIARPGHGAAEGARAFAAGGMRLQWRHRSNRLHGRLSAPSHGWLSVGFNDRSALADTRFVIISVADDGSVVADERVARPPRHLSISDVGGRAVLDDLTGRRVGDGTEAAFSLPHRFADGVGPNLAPGAVVHLMLAWSHERDFDHHSAWRGHFKLTL